MPLEPRRRSLLAALGSLGAASLAGCGQSQRPLGSLPSPPPEPVDDFRVRKVRTDDQQWFFRTDDAPATTDPSEPYPDTYELVESTADLEEITFNPDLALAGDLRSFVEGVDLESHTVLLFQQKTNACMDQHLVKVAYGRDDLDLDFCSEPRPADMACSPDERHGVGYAIVLPFDEVDVTSFGFGSGRGCPDTLPIEPVSVDSDPGGEQ